MGVDVTVPALSPYTHTHTHSVFDLNKTNGERDYFHSTESEQSECLLFSYLSGKTDIRLLGSD